MTKNKSTKRALLTSALALLLCVSMLIGSTFAWFTDSVTSSGNIIKSGKLDVEMYWAEGNEDPAALTWKKVDGAIFTNEKWEPGYVEAKHVKITNEGNLAFKWKLQIVPNGEVEELADVIDVYYVEGATQLTRQSLEGVTPVCTLRDLINDADGAAHGALLPAGETATDAYERVGEVTATLAFKMREEAGNEYQDKKIGTDFSLKLMATQYTYEDDSFDNQYDANAKYDVDIWDGKTVITPVADADGVYHISTAAELVGMMNDSKYPNCNKYQNVVLENNIDLIGRTVSGFGDGSGFFDGIFDGQGYTIKNFKIDATNRTYYAGLFNQVTQYSGENTVIKNLTVADATIKGTSQVGAIAGGMNGNTVVENCKVMNCDLYAVKKVGSVVGYTAGGTVTNNYAENCNVFYSEKEGAEILGYENTGSTVNNNTAKNVTVAKFAEVSTSEELSTAISNGATTLILGSGTFSTPVSAQGKTLTFIGTGNTVIDVKDYGAGEGDGDYSLDGSSVTFENVTLTTKTTYFPGYVRTKGTYNNCTIDGVWTLYDSSEFNNCTFNVSGDIYNVWTWGAAKATFNKCTFNNDGKAILVYGGGNTKLTVNGCTFNDNGGLTSKKAAIEVGAGYGSSFDITVNNTVVNGYEINDEGLNTGTTLWGNKNSMGTDKLNVVVDGVDVY